MKILVLEMNEENKKMAERLFSGRNDTAINVVHPHNINELLACHPCEVFFIPLEADGLDGTELCRKIKAVYPDCVVYAYSPHLQRYHSDTLEEVGFDGFIKKPAKKETLMTAIDGALAKLHRFSFAGEMR